MRSSQPGFKSFETQVTVAAGDRARVATQFAVGQAEQTVTVESTTPALQTDESTIGTLITSQANPESSAERTQRTNLVTVSAGVTLGMRERDEWRHAAGRSPSDSNFSANGQSDIDQQQHD